MKKILEIIILILTVFTVTSCNAKQVDNRYLTNSPTKQDSINLTLD